MRTWSRQFAYEDRNRAAGLCTRAKSHGKRDPSSKNLCRKCLRLARVQRRKSRP